MAKNSKFSLKKIFIITAAVVLVGGILFLRAQYVVPVLMYHSVDEKAQQTKLSVCPASFDRQMKFLSERNYNVVTLQELVDITEKGRGFSSKTVAITFDDGYENNYTCVFPVIKKYNIPVTIFVVMDKVGREGYLSWRQIREMTESGLVSVGSHTFNHTYLPDVSDKGRLRIEIFKSKQLLQMLTGQENIFFSYPLGGFNEKIRKLAIEAGYAGACATNPGGKYPDNDIYAIKRVRVSRTSDNLFVFWIESSGYYTFIKEIRDED